MTTYVSDERLADIIDGFTGLEICAPGDHLGPEETLQLARELQSLRSLSSDSVSDGSKGARVKPLEWKANGATSLWTGELIFGVYYIAYDEGDGWRSFRGQFLSNAGSTELAFGDKASVFSAAQADYEQRILAALDSGTGGQQPVAWRWKNWNSSDWSVGEVYPPGAYSAEPLYSSPTDPKAGVVSEDMVERAKAAVRNDPDVHISPSAMRAALTAALNGEKP